MEHAIVAALDGDRSHQQAFRDALRERAALTHARLNAIDGITVGRADRGVLRDAESRAAARRRPTRTTCSALLRATGVLCVYGSGFGTAPEDGFFRVVFLASPAELAGIYDLIARVHARVPRGSRGPSM